MVNLPVTTPSKKSDTPSPSSHQLLIAHYYFKSPEEFSQGEFSDSLSPTLASSDNCLFLHSSIPPEEEWLFSDVIISINVCLPSSSYEPLWESVYFMFVNIYIHKIQCHVLTKCSVSVLEQKKERLL